MEKHARDSARGACTKSVSLDDGCDVVQERVVRGRDEHLGCSALVGDNDGLG